MFRDDFVWGVASSSYQVEGTDANDGRGKNVWDAFTEAGRIYENQNAYTTCDHMHHYKEDYALMKILASSISFFIKLGTYSAARNRTYQ